MAQYQVGSSRYEIPDNLSEQQLNAVLTQLAAQEKQQPQQGTDGAFAYSVDKAQEMLGKGVEVAGDLVGSQTIKDYGTSVVEQQRKVIARSCKSVLSCTNCSCNSARVHALLGFSSV